MEITIKYESTWRNSFLEDQEGNHKPLPAKGRKYIASGQALGNDKNFIRRNITQETVLGVLCRLIGDQRKLYQARASEHFYFKEMEDQITWSDHPTLWDEIIYLRNISGNDDPNSFTGALKYNAPILNSDFSQMLWHPLGLSQAALVDFIIDDQMVKQVGKQGNPIELTPFGISHRFNEIKKLKPIPITPELEKALEMLSNAVEGSKLFKNDKIAWEAVYCSALYLQVSRLIKQGQNLEKALSKQGKISGISPNNFTQKDFISKLTTTGKKKMVWGNPYVMKQKIKGQGETVSMLQKARGQLIIQLNLSKDQAKELKQLIENAGVSSFYLGKKGLAYVTKIRL